MPVLTAVGTERGADGKSFVSVFLAEAKRAAAMPVTVVDADDAGRLADGVPASRLGEVLSEHEVILFGAGPADSAIEADADVLNQFWDELGQLARRGDVLVDMGANVVQKFTRYAAEMNIDRRWSQREISIQCVVPICNSDDSFAKGIKTLRNLRAALPSASIFALLNYRDGPFVHWQGTDDWAALKRLEHDRVRILELPRCDAPASAWAALEREKLSPFVAAEMTEEELAQRLQVNEDVAARAQARIVRWISATYTALGDLLPQRNES